MHLMTSDLRSGATAVLYLVFLPVYQVQGQIQTNNKSESLRNLTQYPVCVSDSDCGAERACFQYMCYPWKTSTGFRWCSSDSDCNSLTTREEGDGRDGRCFRHQDTEDIGFGICLKKM